MVTVALEAGATEATMMDNLPIHNALWKVFEERCQKKGLKGYKMISDGDVNDLSKLGQYDIVHCSGVIYHMPNPVHTMLQLRSVTLKYLLLTSMVVPELIKTEAGEVDMRGRGSIFVPAISGVTKDVCGQYLDSLEIQIHGINSEEPFHWVYTSPLQSRSPHMSELFQVNYGPWWWLFTQSFVENLLSLVGFRIVSSGELWEKRSVGFLAEKVKFFSVIIFKLLSYIRLFMITFTIVDFQR